MKIVVTAQGNSPEARVDPRFGRAAWLYFVDLESGACEAVDNAAQCDAAQGAGIGTAQCVADHGARAVLTGDCGPKATQALEAAGIEIQTGVGGTVADAVEAYRARREATP